MLTVFIITMSCDTKQQRIQITGEAQGSYYSVIYYDKEQRDFSYQIDSLLKAFDGVASLWCETSEINAVNDNQDIVLSPMFVDIFNKSQEISELSDGAFDITVGKLVKMYGFLKQHQEEITDKKNAEYLNFVGYNKVWIEDNKLFKKDTNIKIDFNAIAQGYSVDVVGDFLLSKGIDKFLVDIGGEVVAKGRKPNGQAWLVGIEQPAENAADAQSVMASIELTDAAIVTSGSYRKYYEKDGKRYSHTIDPHTGKPIEHNLLSVSVYAPKAWQADALATMFMVKGVDESLQMLETMPNIEAYFILADTISGFKTVSSNGFILK
ncbi:FAD:protein FMN transferase [Bacteroidia bacterium]|nr:FAD:protein FMN transferase [Bacteroidia bacterium]